MLESNLAILKLSKRAEQVNSDHLLKTFVDTGSILTLISNIDSQVIYGRRGTGKTHVLSVLAQKKQAQGEVAIQIDMRNIGSAGGIYGDPSIPISQRATRLLIDTLGAVHERLMDIATEPNSIAHIGILGPALDVLFDSIRTVQVVGTTTLEVQNAQSGSKTNAASITSSVTGLVSTMSASGSIGANTSNTSSTRTSTIGQSNCRVNFGSVGEAFRQLIRCVPHARLWILIDEWSEIPLDLQPYLADLLRRSTLPIPGISVKIAAIEQRTRFRIEDEVVGHIGIQVGADIATSLNLDEYMVFDNDESASIEFFRQLIFKHVNAVNDQDNITLFPTSAGFISTAFTQSNAFEELVRAAEGVPRDAINILGQAAQKAQAEKISIPHIRAAAQRWYQSAKEKAVSTNPRARLLLSWIIDHVIQGRRAKAFLLENTTKDDLIDYLYDERVLHVLKQGISAQDLPGRRFNVYGIDYGCYVDLITTDRAPQGLLDIGEDESNFVDVPRTDFRSIRRSILDLQLFYSEHGSDLASRTA